MISTIETFRAWIEWRLYECRILMAIVLTDQHNTTVWYKTWKQWQWQSVWDLNIHLCTVRYWNGWQHSVKTQSQVERRNFLVVVTLPLLNKARISFTVNLMCNVSAVCFCPLSLRFPKWTHVKEIFHFYPAFLDLCTRSLAKPLWIIQCVLR